MILGRCVPLGRRVRPILVHSLRQKRQWKITGLGWFLLLVLDAQIA